LGFKLLVVLVRFLIKL